MDPLIYLTKTEFYLVLSVNFLAGAVLGGAIVAIYTLKHIKSSENGNFDQNKV